MKTILRYTCILAAVLFGNLAHAQHAAPRLAVSISCSCNDAMGQAYVAAVKDILSKDAHFQQMSSREGALRGAIRVHIISMPLESADGTQRSALSIVFTHDGTLVHQFIETCAHIPIADCAMNMIQDLKQMDS